MPQNLQIILISPSAHYPSHYWPNTVALMRALRRKGQRVRAIIFSTGMEPVPPDLQGGVEPVFSRTPLPWRRLAAGRWPEQRFTRLTSICETLACLFKAVRLTRGCPRPHLAFSRRFAVDCHAGRAVVSKIPLCLLALRRLGARAREWSDRKSPLLQKLLERAVATGRIGLHLRK